jgi:hypothetical protein
MFTAIAVLTLATGIATTTTIFALVDELALKPARATSDRQIHRLMGSGGLVQIPDYEIVAGNRPPGIEAVAAFDVAGGGLVQIPGRAERVVGWRVTGGYTDVHRVGARIGRWISDDDNAGGQQDPTVTFRGKAVPVVLGTLGQDVAVISDPSGLTVWVFVPLFMLAVGVVAAIVPARRAVRVEPHAALKEL